ncbi:MAG: hypothetical protein Q4E83_05580 [bacterium]|nr:hypothetical protein [bacterium]
MKLNNNTNIFTPNIKNSDEVKITNQNKISSQKPLPTDKITFKSSTKTVARQEVFKNILPKFMLGTTFLAGLELLMHNANANNENNIKKLDSYDKELVKIGLPTKEEFKNIIENSMTYDWQKKENVYSFTPEEVELISNAYDDEIVRSKLIYLLATDYNNFEGYKFKNFSAEETIKVLELVATYPEQENFIISIIERNKPYSIDNGHNNYANKYNFNDLHNLVLLRFQNPNIEKFIDNTINDKNYSNHDVFNMINLKLKMPDFVDKLIHDVTDNTTPLNIQAFKKIISSKEPKKTYETLNKIFEYCKQNNIQIDNLYYEKITSNWVIQQNGDFTYKYQFDNETGNLVRLDKIYDATPELKMYIHDKNSVCTTENNNIEIKMLNEEKVEKFSNIIPNKINTWIKKGGQESVTRKIVNNEYSKNGELKVIEKSLESYDGTTTDYGYNEDKNGNSFSYIHIKDAGGKSLLDYKHKFKKIDDNHFISIENDKRYDIVYFDDKVTVTQKDNKTGNELDKVTLEIGENESETSLLSKDLLRLLKKLSGSAYFDIAKSNTKIYLKKGSQKQNATFRYHNYNKATSIIVSDYFNNLEDIFVLQHEIGHLKDFQHKIKNNNDLIDIFKKEREMLFKKAPLPIINSLCYFVSKDSTEYNALKEIIGEVNAFLYASNNSPMLESRGHFLQEYFPQTFAKIANLLLNTTSQKSFINKESRF